MTEKEIEETKIKLLQKVLKDERCDELHDDIIYYGMLDGFQFWRLDNYLYELTLNDSTYIKVNPSDLSYTWIFDDEGKELWPRIYAENPELHTYEARKKRQDDRRKRLMEYRKIISKEQGIEFIPQNNIHKNIAKHNIKRRPKMDEKQKKEYFLKGNGYYLDEYELAKALTRPKTLADIEYEQQLDDYLAKQQEKYRKAKKEKSEKETK